MKIFCTIGILFLMVACGDPKKLWPMKTKKIQKIEPASPENYSYELRSDDCSTGEHFFATFDQACNALKDDELNNNCAVQERVQLFENSECSGSFS